MRRVFALLLVTPLLVNCSDPATTPVAPPGAVLAQDESPMQGPDMSAVMAFGNPDAGTPYPPQSHDQSLHGKDRVIPGTVVIAAGGTVTFQVYPGHRVAVYDDGTRPEDITINPTGPFILDPVNRLALQPTAAPIYTYTFQEPGRYLVICAARRHFLVANMWGWVIVK